MPDPAFLAVPAMFRDHPIIDAAGYKIENPIVFLDYVPLPARDRIRLVRDTHGGLLWEIDDRSSAGSAGIVARHFPAGQGLSAAPLPAGAVVTAHGAMFQRLRRADLAREGIDAQVIYPTVARAFAGLQDCELAVALCRAYNDYIRADCAAAPSLFIPMGVVPLQDVAASVEELRRCVVDLDMPGVVLPPCVPLPHPAAMDAFPLIQARRHLDAAEMAPFYETAEYLDAALVVHPTQPTAAPFAAADQVAAAVVADAVDRRSAVQAAMAHVVVGGVLERFSGLRFGFFDVGCGWVPELVRSLGMGWVDRGAARGTPSLWTPRYVVESLREPGGGGLRVRQRRLRDLRRIAAVPDASEPQRAALGSVPAERNLEEYFARGQLFFSVAADDPAPAWLRHAFGPVGEKIACWTSGYGTTSRAFSGCVARSSGDPQIGLDFVARLMSLNAQRLYGNRLQRRISVRSA